MLVLGWGMAVAAPPTTPPPPSSGAPPPAASTTPLDRAYQGTPAPAGGEKYVGVAPGGTAHNPLPPAGKAPPHLIWSGFQSGQGTSKVFFQTNLPVTFDVGQPATARGSKAPSLSVFLRNCRIHLRNNSRHLDTRFFATPVEGVTAVQHHKDVELKIALKQPATPTSRTEPGPDGTQFLVLEFPPGLPAADQPDSHPHDDARAPKP
jgi:hypothetical protein